MNSEIRLVCNAAGSLLPTLAERIKNTFHCTVLPSYGMTECMPISTPPLSYALDRPGTSGIITGPELKIMDGNDKEVANFVTGRIVSESRSSSLLLSDRSKRLLSMSNTILPLDGAFRCANFRYLT